MLQGLIREVAGSKSGGPEGSRQVTHPAPLVCPTRPWQQEGFLPSSGHSGGHRGATPAQPPSGTTTDAAIALLMSQTKMGQRLLQF